MTSSENSYPGGCGGGGGSTAGPSFVTFTDTGGEAGPGTDRVQQALQSLSHQVEQISALTHQLFERIAPVMGGGDTSTLEQDMQRLADQPPVDPERSPLHQSVRRIDQRLVSLEEDIKYVLNRIEL